MVALPLETSMTVALPKAKRAGSGEGWVRVFTFGVSYAIASLSCTLPVFLSVVATQLTQRSLAGGVAVFVAYAAGMSIVLIGLTVGMALGKQSLVSRLRDSARYINRVSGAILIIAGLFIVWFWGTEIAVGATALGSSPAFRFVENLSQTALNFVADNTALVAGALVVLLVGAGVFAWRQRTLNDDDAADGEAPSGSAKDLADVTGSES